MDLAERMKLYEESARTVLPRRLPVILRVDGRAFHTYTRKLKPFNENMSDVMIQTAIALCEEVQGAVMAYTQSDEISVLVHGYQSLDSSPWFDNQVQKMASIAASVASTTFTLNSWQIWDRDTEYRDRAMRTALFDARVFPVSESDVANYFIWRQQDCSRNSMQMLARTLFSHKEINGKNFNEMGKMCFDKGSDWNALAPRWTRGVAVVKQPVSQPAERHGAMGPDFYTRQKWTPCMETPLFTTNRHYIERFFSTALE